MQLPCAIKLPQGMRSCCCAVSLLRLCMVVVMVATPYSPSPWPKFTAHLHGVCVWQLLRGGQVLAVVGHRHEGGGYWHIMGGKKGGLQGTRAVHATLLLSRLQYGKSPGGLGSTAGVGVEAASGHPAQHAMRVATDGCSHLCRL